MKKIIKNNIITIYLFIFVCVKNQGGNDAVTLLFWENIDDNNLNKHVVLGHGYDADWKLQNTPKVEKQLVYLDH
ncbi:hypothetical protein BJJLLNOG_00152 [Ostreid herpesvirus 1]|nr:hypothetical protein LKIMDMGE_00147 [Ostreid herpesvirus 1]UPX72317.1 hypothetical protein LKIMDMGE_00152 [Ostreid herpesvirus 1]UPX72471.1 hypothetical protein AADDAKMG_00145 [Ostreid herpesvirus 1]UPX72476.1 hypothetical protein AADDAKMG_00150 [Ostreid herpesvirus 1]UPX72631.1 hypothetical protein CEAEFCCE_00146 [Ostreid herpesvirus 1]